MKFPVLLRVRPGKFCFMDTRNKISAIIIDPEKESIANVEAFLSLNCKDVEVVARSSSSNEIMDLLNLHAPDILYLNSVLIPDDLPNNMERKRRNIEIVFIVENDDFAIKAFEYSALYCIKKPIDKIEVEKSVDRLRQREKTYSFKNLERIYKEKKGQDCRIMLPDVFGFRLVNVNQIIRCEADGCYTNFYLDNGEKVVGSKSLSSFEILLPEYLFCRVHSRHLVNLNFVQHYMKGRGGKLVLTDGSSVEVSEKKKKNFIDQLGFFGYSFLEYHHRTKDN